MKCQSTFLIIAIFTLLSFPVVSWAQTINLGTAANFVLFTSNGAIDNLGASYFTGDLGTNVGSYTGFGTSTINGNQYSANSITAQASTDVIAAYNQLKNIAPTNSTHTPAFGTETLFPGVYSIAAAGSVGGTLILDAQGNANAVFIFKIGGALTTGASSIISLINGASSCNVYWVAEGAISMAASTQMKGTLIANNAANSMGAGCTLEGRLFSTTGAISTNTSTAKLPVCGLVAPAWVGVISTDWNNPSNWANGIIPSITTNITIPANTTYAPLLSSGTGSVQNIIIQSGATLTVTGGKLQIAGTITNSGIFDASIGTIELNGATTAQTISIGAFKNNNLQNLIISNNVNLADTLNLSGKLSFGNSNFTLSTGNHLTLKSTATGTAMVADITNGGFLSGNTISGLVSVERYISAKRSWRLLSIPIASINAPTINVAWQEGVGGNSTSNPNPGYGAQITGGTMANGFDQGVNGNSSLKIYNYVTNSLVGLPANPGTNIPITNYPGYFLFIRGDRSTVLLQGVGATLSSTTLRMKGQLVTGNVAINLNAGNTTLVGNPYCSAVDFHTLTKNNVNDMFYAWNPQLNGANGVGGYVTVSWNGSSYDIVPSPSTVTQYIQSGEAVFVQSPDAALTAQLTFKEADKKSGGSNFVFKPMTGSNGTLSINLLAANQDGTSYISDGILTSYNLNNSNAIDNNDAKKMYNNAENICIAREGKDFSIERRKTIIANDTTFLNVYNLKKQTYKLQITGQGMDSIGLHAILKDKYLGIQKDTLLNMGGVTEIVFMVNTDSASFAKDRFSIVFQQKLIVLPVTVSLVKVTRFQKDVQLEWKTSGQLQVKAYVVEVSADNILFTKAAVINKVGEEPGQLYAWLDKFVVCGTHYYRIRTINNSGKETISETVNIDIHNGCDKKYIEVEDNCMKGNHIALELNNINPGKYALSISSMDGIICKQIAIEQTGSNSVKDILMENYLASGKYQVVLSGNGLIYTTYFMK